MKQLIQPSKRSLGFFFISLVGLLMLSVTFLSGDSGFWQTNSFQDLNIPDKKIAEKKEQKEGLYVVQMLPKGRIGIGDQKKEVVVVFSQPIVPLGTLQNLSSINEKPFVIQPEVAGKYRWYGSRACAFIPEKSWEAGQEYTVILNKKVKSLSGDMLNKEQDFSFIYKLPPLTLKYASPSRGSVLEYKPKLVFFFNYPVNLAQLQTNMSVKVNQEKRDFRLSYLKESNEKNLQDRVQLRFLSELPRDAQIHIHFNRGIQAEGYKTKTTKSYSLSYKTYGPLEVSLSSPPSDFQDYWGFYLRFSSPVKYSDVAKAIQFSPEVPSINANQASNESSTIIYLNRWQLRAGQSYQLRISNLKDIYGNSLKEPVVFDIKMPNYRPYIHVERGHKIIEATLEQKIGVSSVNVPEVNFIYGEITLADVQRYAVVTNRDSLHRMIQTKKVPWKLDTQWNQPGESVKDLSSFLDNGYGWLYLDFESSHQSYYQPRMYLQSTDLGMTIWEWNQSAAVRIHGITSGQGKSGVFVHHYRGNDANGYCQTDEDGYCLLIKKKSGIVNSGFFYAHKEKDKAFVTHKNHKVYHSFYNYDLVSQSNRSMLRGAVLFDRGLYRPGDKVYFKIVLSLVRDGSVNPVNSQLIQVSVKDSRGKIVLKKNLISTSEGGVFDDLVLDKNSPLGHYTVTAVFREKTSLSNANLSVSESFQVEEFRPVTFSVDLQAPGEIYGQSNINVLSQGRYLFGAPMAEADFRWTAMAEALDPNFANYGDYTFGDEDWNEKAILARQSQMYANGEGNLDAKGEYTIRLNLAAKSIQEQISDNKQISLNFPYQLNLSATVKNVDHQSVTKTEKISVYPANFFVGLKMVDRYQSYNHPFVLNMAIVDKKGKAVSGKKIDVYVISQKWESVQVKGSGDSYYWKNTSTKTLMEKKQVVSRGAFVSHSIRVKQAGEYWVIAHDPETGVYSRTYFYAFGGAAHWMQADDDSVSLLPDKKKYLPGDVAKVMVQSPFPKAEAIVTVEREKVFWQKKITLSSQKQMVEIPIQQKFFPNAFVSVVLIKPRTEPGEKLTLVERVDFFRQDRGRPAMKYGIVSLQIDDPNIVMPLQVSLNKKEYSPRERVVIDLKSLPGSEVVLTVADRGVLDLIQYRFPNMHSRVYSHWPLLINLLENRRFLLKQYLKAQKGKVPGGDSGPDGDSSGGFAHKDEDGTRKNFRYTAYWNPKIVMNSNGKATVSFTLPDNLTTFKVFALAVKKNRFGLASDELRVRKVIVAQKLIPRFIRSGDQVRIGALAINQAKIGAEFMMTVSAPGLRIKDGGSSQRFFLKPNGVKEVVLPVELENVYLQRNKINEIAGYITVKPVNLSAFLRLGYKKNEIQEKVTFSLPVRKAQIREAFTVAGYADNRQKEGVVLPQTTQDAGMYELRLSMAPTALIGLERGYQFFYNNPYLCAEQRASAFLLAISSGKLNERFAGKNMKSKNQGYDFGQIEKLFLGSIQNFQNRDGGFRFWEKSRSTYSYPYLTAYIVFVLQEAKLQGYKVNEQLLNKALSYLLKYLLKPEKNNPYLTLETLSFIDYILSRGNRANPNLTDFIYEKRRALSLRAKSFLMLSILANSSLNTATWQARSNELFESIMSRMEVNTRRISFKEVGTGAYRQAFYTEASTMGIILRMMIQYKPEHIMIPQLIRQIMVMQSVYWQDSHSTGNTALALLKYAEKFEGTKPAPFTGEVLLDLNKLWSQSMDPQEQKSYSMTLDQNALAQYKKSGSQSLEFIKIPANNGRLYYTASLVYEPVIDISEPRDEGIEVQRDYFQIIGFANMSKKFVPIKNKSIQLKQGEPYLVRLSVTNGKPIPNFLLVDSLPASNEVVNSAFVTENPNLMNLLSRTNSRGDVIYEYRDDRVVIVQNYLYAGMHEFFYIVRPLYKGSMNQPAAQAKAMYEVEIFGRTGNLQVVVD